MLFMRAAPGVRAGEAAGDAGALRPCYYDALELATLFYDDAPCPLLYLNEVQTPLPLQR